MILPKNSFKFLLYFVRKQKWSFIVIIMTSIVWASNDAFFPYFLKLIINVLENYNGLRTTAVYAALATPLILLTLFWLANEVFARLQGIISIYTFPKFRASIRESVFDYVKSHSHEYFSNHFAGNIAKKLGDLPVASQNVMESICFQFITAMMGAILVLIMMWMVKPIFALILAIWLCLHLGFTFLFLKKSDELWEIHASSLSILGGKIVDALTNMLNVRLFARGFYEKKYLAIFQKDEIKKSQRAMWCVEIMRICLGLSGLALLTAIFVTLIQGWINRWVTVGDITQIGMQVFWLMGWIWHVSFQINILTRDMGTIGDSLTLIRKQHELIDSDNALEIKIKQGEIIFKDVTFAYRQGRPVFNKLNLCIAPGEKVGLVGFSGSGKTTFVNLILRFYDVQSGKILIDGYDIATVQQESLRAQIAMIPQDPALFHRSLMENIRYGNLTASDHEVKTAAKLAHCDEFIEKLENGYESLVGERGIKLSGGQRQRIAIARAILKNAPILIMDEATSSLDSVTEKLIQNSLQRLMADKTTIIVAHRLSTLATMDRILVFHHGEIIESGSQESLLKANGHFAKLWHMQVHGFLPEGEV